MKANEVLRQYKAGRRDFHGEIIRGQSFKGQDLSEADFSGADIRSANFTNAKLEGANFGGVRSGIKQHWVICLSGILFFLSILSGFIWGLASGWTVSLLVYKKLNYTLPGVLFLILFLFFYIVTVRKGLETALGFLVVAVAVTFALTFALSISLPVLREYQLAGITTILLATTLAGTIIAIVTLVIAGVVSGIGGFARNIIFAFIGTAILALYADYSAMNLPHKLVGVVGIATMSLVLGLLSSYFAWLSLSGDDRFASIRKIAITFAALWGTSFRDADLTDANFTEAKLKNTDFRKASITRTLWYCAKEIDRACPGNTYLQNVKIRNLVITGSGQNENFNRLDLRGINLQKANLQNTSFIETDLSQANLQGANLFEAKLVRTNLDQANLNNTCLTGGYIEDWGITRKTRLDGVKCKYVYLKLPTKGDRDPNRMPPSEQGEFGEHDFNIFITSVLDTLELYHKENINAGLAITILKGLTEEYPIQFELVGLEKRGDNQFVIRLKVFGQTSHFQLQREYYDRYEQALPLYDPKKLMPSTDVVVEKIIETVRENPGTHIENLHNQGIVVTGGSVNISDDHRTIHTGGGNYNERIEGDYIQQ